MGIVNNKIQEVEKNRGVGVKSVDDSKKDSNKSLVVNSEKSSNSSGIIEPVSGVSSYVKKLYEIAKRGGGYDKEETERYIKAKDDLNNEDYNKNLDFIKSSQEVDKGYIRDKGAIREEGRKHLLDLIGSQRGKVEEVTKENDKISSRTKLGLGLLNASELAAALMNAIAVRNGANNMIVPNVSNKWLGIAQQEALGRQKRIDELRDKLGDLEGNLYKQELQDKLQTIDEKKLLDDNITNWKRDLAGKRFRYKDALLDTEHRERKKSAETDVKYMLDAEKEGEKQRQANAKLAQSRENALLKAGRSNGAGGVEDKNTIRFTIDGIDGSKPKLVVVNKDNLLATLTANTQNINDLSAEDKSALDLTLLMMKNTNQGAETIKSNLLPFLSKSKKLLQMLTPIADVSDIEVKELGAEDKKIEHKKKKGTGIEL